jgi:hypothetical protein
MLFQFDLVFRFVHSFHSSHFQDKVFTFHFLPCGTIPPPVLMFNGVAFGYPGKKALYKNLEVSSPILSYFNSLFIAGCGLGFAYCIGGAERCWQEYTAQAHCRRITTDRRHGACASTFENRQVCHCFPMKPHYFLHSLSSFSRLDIINTWLSIWM